ncbi:hypothetical protein [Enterovibrio norvegicus]|uniref:Uncharacterized protein n=1 Tax=Enterovibrio norvegicus TaxID=188144 RepID=A0A2N7L8C1_9GAMM|nr:hypothetical protein [Enterovibrio norvegicus]PML77391.1 hypothetical protein BCT69_20370 [Enterovibrio norvegicus]PMN70707.1 hypothetical protein BCT27_03080 [Enterovibrio norvegicus]PMN90459.1 hypothetical protein BCT23_19470 [Enterovibrio norvegicus]
MIKIQETGRLSKPLDEARKILVVPQGYAGFCFQPQKFPDQVKTVLTTTGVGPCHCLIIVEDYSDSVVLCHLDESFTARAFSYTTRLLEILRDGCGEKSPKFSVSIASSSPTRDTVLRGGEVLRAVNAFGSSDRMEAPVAPTTCGQTDHAFTVGDPTTTHHIGDIDQNKYFDKSDGVPGWSTWQRIGGMSPGLSGRRIRLLTNLDVAPKQFVKPV